MPSPKKSASFLTFTLHSHLPYVVNHGTWPHGMEWLHEAAAETYLPMLRMFRRLEADGLALHANINLTPILLEQLAHPVFKREFKGYVLRKIQAAKEDQAFFMQSDEAHFAQTAVYWQDYYQQALDDFRDLDEDIVGGFRYFHNKGMIELITCGATHGYFPLLGTDESIHAQVQMAVRTHQRHIGHAPRGIWNPEAGYRPAGMWQQPMVTAGEESHPAPFYRRGVEEFLADGGIDYFHVDTTLIDRAINFTPATKRYSPYDLMQRSREILSQRPPQHADHPDDAELRAIATQHSAAESAAQRATQQSQLAEAQSQGEHRTFYQPYYADGPNSREHPVAAFPRDPKTGVQVWSGDAGYPGDGLYLDFHKKRWPGGHRYWQVTGSKIDMAYKTPYYPQEAAARTRNHAEHYVSLVFDALKDGFQDEKPPILCSPFDAELFGHWWFEGPMFLEQIVRVLADNGPEFPVKLINGSAYLHEYGAAGFMALPEGSWGKNGTNEVWLNEETSWTWPHIYRAEHIIRDIATEGRWREGYDQDHDFSDSHHHTQFPMGNVRISKPSQAELEGKEDSEGRPLPQPGAPRLDSETWDQTNARHPERVHREGPLASDSAVDAAVASDVASDVAVASEIGPGFSPDNKGTKKEGALAPGTKASASLAINPNANQAALPAPAIPRNTWADEHPTFPNPNQPDNPTGPDANTQDSGTAQKYESHASPGEKKYVPDVPPVPKTEGSTNDTLPLRIMKQLCRELMLMESSDWQFLITTQAAKDYAEERFVVHTDQFNQLHAIWKHWEQHGQITEQHLADLAYLEERDSVFPDIDPSLWQRRFEG
jgi:1,4-alpha-glucan branching enzyme